MPPSPIRKLVPFAESARKRGVNVYHLNIGQPDIETPKPILDAVRQSNFKILEYSHSAGNESYRRKLVTYYNRFDIAIDPEQIVVTTGGSEAIVFGFMACLDAGDEVIVPEPFYANYSGFAVEAGVNIKTITSTIETGFALPAMVDFEKAITPRTRAILICNPNNPTGYLYSREELEVLKELCLKHNLFLFSDEAYREFCYTGEHFSAMNLEGMDENVILMDTISKRYSACGGRIGAFITRNQSVLDSAMKFAQARLSPPSFAQIAGEAAVDLPTDYFNGIKAEYMTRRDLQNQMASLKKPWEIGKSFDHAAVLGPIHPVAKVGHPTKGEISLAVNGTVRQDADLDKMIWSVAEQISKLSEAFELKAGDIIYSGTPANVGPVVKGDVLLAKIAGFPDMSIKIV